MSLNSNICCFCEEFSSGMMPNSFIETVGFNKRLLDESENYVVFPSVSPLAEGHILIAPKKHVKSIKQSAHLIENELLDIIKTWNRTLTTKYGFSVMFEHGVASNAIGGCGVDHAHLHLLPLRELAFKDILFTAQKEYNFQEVSSYMEFLELSKFNFSYLMLGSIETPIYYSLNSEFPSQYLRKLIALNIKKLEWNWNYYFGWNEFKNTFHSLK